ncbi:MAG: ABC transporter substrate-binding protein [Ndongobacter sp.]|nr:ABC transporter substrate-binding protein [Ndongobacter sp.]
MIHFNKKVHFAALLAALLLFATSCGSGNGAKTASSADASDASGGTAAESTSETVLFEDGTLDFATNVTFPPYEFYEGDAMTGIDIDIAQAIGEKLGVPVKFHDMEFTNILASIDSGKVDAGIAGMSVTPDRLESARFSDPYTTSIQSIIVAEGSPIATAEDLAGKKIGTQLGTTGDMYAKENFGEENVQGFDKGADAVLALSNGKVDAVIIDNEPAKNFVAANKGLTLLDSKYAEEEYAIALNKTNDALLKEINAALAELKKDGTLQAIIEKYIPAK